MHYKNVMPILLAEAIEFLHTKQVSALFMFRLGQILLYMYVLCHHNNRQLYGIER
jgi:hypothetical protein